MSSDVKKIVYVTGTRADYGLMHNTLSLMHESEGIELQVVVTGMHLMKEFGETITEVRKDPFSLHVVDEVFEHDDRESMASFLGRCTVSFSSLFAELRPNLILLLGDRAEMLAAANAAVYLGIPIAHVHGGDVSGNVDDSVRHAITKLSTFHFAANATSARRIMQMGEARSSVYTVGAPGLDDIDPDRVVDREAVLQSLGLDPNRKIGLVVQHPESTGDHNEQDIRSTMDALLSLKYQCLVIYPNADAGGRKMIEVIKEYESAHSDVKSVQNLPRDKYLVVLRSVDVMVGNSSSGVIETGLLKLPVVNIGHRQHHRDKGANVIDCDAAKASIVNAVEDAVAKRDNLIPSSPYGDGTASSQIVAHLAQISLDNLPEKEFVDIGLDER